MAGFLDQYGVSDAKRERVWKRLLGAALLITVLGTVGYFIFRDWSEKAQAKKFFTLLEQKKYDDAYRLWGCDPAKPCRDYDMARFLEDWGPKSTHADPGKMKITATKSCKGGIIQILQYGEGDEVLLYVDRKDLVISFAPWPVCNPRWQAP
jgi:hypothetical protein